MPSVKIKETEPFDILWNRLWVNHNSNAYRNDRFQASELYKKLDIPKLLNETLDNEFGPIFKHIFISENYGVGKPDPEFYKIAIKEIGIDPLSILYIGDSIQLDMEPAEKMSLKAVLIDRDNVYPNYKNRITSLEALTLYL